MKRRIFLSVLLAALILLSANAWAAITIVGHFTGGGGTTFDIGTFTNDKDTERGGLLGISHKVSITFGGMNDRNEWNSFVALWRKAQQTRAASFQFIGTFKETGTDYNSLLTVAAGPGVQFTINDKPGTFIFVLSPSDYASFDAAVAKVSAYLGSK